MIANTTYHWVRRQLALELMSIDAVLTSDSNHPLVVTRGKERGFKLKLHETNPDAPLSPFYLNLRTPDNPKQGPLTPTIVDLAARCMLTLSMDNKKLDTELRPDAVAGVPRAGDPFALDVARLSGRPFLQMNKVTIDGQRRVTSIVNADTPQGSSVLLVDDLITSADSKREAIEVLRDAGLKASHVIVLVDREQGGREELAKLGCTLHSVYTITDLLDLYVEEGKMTPQLRNSIRTYLGST